MSFEKNMNLFISYSHLDEEKIKEFIKHLAPLKSNGIIQEWYDRKIIAGHDFQNDISNNLENANIICLFISANFLNSHACMREKDQAVIFRKKKGIAVIPIILSDCGWKDDKDLATMLALPNDGKPISYFTDSDAAWHSVYNALKDVIEYENKFNSLKIKTEFKMFLDDAELLTKAHSQKENILIEDIFIYPDLINYDDVKEYNKKENSENIIDDIYENSKILIAGEGQSGKTTLCKKAYDDLLKKRFVPVYINIKPNEYAETISIKIKRAFEEQYESMTYNEISPNRIIPIIDDFHLNQRKEKYIKELSKFVNQIVIVDDIFRMNFRDENLIKDYSLFRIKEFNPALRNELIKKWTQLTDKKNGSTNTQNQVYQNIDHTTELVNTALGKVLGSGIMPSYPFFILSVISTYDTLEKPLDQEITSQGYCYQALIFLSLRKQGVKNDEIDTYINFLTEFAFNLFKEKSNELPIDKFNSFMKIYLNKFNFPIKQEILLSKLQNGHLINLDSCNNFSFYYQYIFYYFVAKYLAEHCEQNKSEIDQIVNNLHKNENAYIAIFISHHSKSIYVLDEIILNAMNLFEKYEPATLNKNELTFFDEQIDLIIKEVLPPSMHTPEKERTKRLELQNNVEEHKETTEEEDNVDAENELSIELRRSVKTVEVMGRIIKNRAGSLEKEKLILVFEEAMKVHLRALTSFFELIKIKKGQEAIIKFISSRLEKIVEEMEKVPKEERLRKNIKNDFLEY